MTDLPARSPRRLPCGLTRFLSAAIAATLTACAIAGAEEAGRATIPFEEVEAGMTGFGRTVFMGRTVESFDVEILGKLENIAPKRNVILARLSGGPLAETGVLQGMSGSPVYLADGRLVGAVAYSWGFSKEPICGITPIDEMLDLLTRREEHPSQAAGTGVPAESRPARAFPSTMRRLAYPASIGTFFSDRLRSVSVTPAAVGLAPLPILLGFPASGRGAAGEALDRWKSLLGSMGLSPVSTGSSGTGEEAGPEPLEPGAAMGVRLISGDVEMAALGTVTWVRGDEFLAMGHNFLALGPTALPATRAEVFGALPSLAASFKLATATSAMGTITQDRFGGIAGRAGSNPRLVPVNVTISSDVDRLTTFNFEVVDDPLLTPILMHLSFLNIFSTAEKAAGDVTLKLRKGSRISLEGGLEVNIENLYSGAQSELIASATVAYMTYLLMNNPDRVSRVEGVDLDMEYSDSLSMARIDRIWTEKLRVAPGETIPLYVSVEPYRGEPFVEVLPLEIPEEAPEGKSILQVGDAITLSRMEYASGGVSIQPRDLEQLVFLLNRIRTNNKIYATLIRPDNGINISGEALPNLPPSLSTILVSPDREDSSSVRVKFRGVLEAERETSYALRGYKKSILEIQR